MAKEEYILILEPGDSFTSLFLAHVDGEGRALAMDWACRPSVGMRGSLPEDIAAAGNMIGELAALLEERQGIDIQTVFCVSGVDILQYHPVADVLPYQRLLEGNPMALQGLPAGEIPSYEDVVDAFDAADPLYRKVASINANHREALQNALQESGCFLEGFLPLPRLSMASTFPTDVLVPYLDIQEDGASFFLRTNGALVTHVMQDFSWQSLLAYLQKTFSLGPEMAAQVLDLEMRPVAAPNLDWEKNVEAQMFLNDNLTTIREHFSDRLERLAICLQQVLDTTGLGDRLHHSLIMPGGGADFYNKYTFLRDIIPLRAAAYEPPDWRFKGVNAPGGRIKLLAGLLPEALSRRNFQRRRLEKKSHLEQARDLSRRLFGR